MFEEGVNSCILVLSQVDASLLLLCMPVRFDRLRKVTRVRRCLPSLLAYLSSSPYIVTTDTAPTEDAEAVARGPA
jgi:hypothetical protein